MAQDGESDVILLDENGEPTEATLEFDDGQDPVVDGLLAEERQLIHDDIEPEGDTVVLESDTQDLGLNSPYTGIPLNAEIQIMTELGINYEQLKAEKAAAAASDEDLPYMPLHAQITGEYNHRVGASPDFERHLRSESENVHAPTPQMHSVAAKHKDGSVSGSARKQQNADAHRLNTIG